MVVNTHLETLVHLATLDVERVVHLGIEITGTALRVAGGQIGHVLPGYLMVAGGLGGQDVHHAVGQRLVTHVLGVGGGQRKTYRVVDIAREELVDADASVVGQRECLVGAPVFNAFFLQVGVVAAPVLGIHIAHFGIGVPLTGDVQSVAGGQRVAVERFGLQSGVAPCLFIVDVEVQHTVPVHAQSLAQRVVHKPRVYLSL